MGALQGMRCPWPHTSVLNATERDAAVVLTSERDHHFQLCLRMLEFEAAPRRALLSLV